MRVHYIEIEMPSGLMRSRIMNPQNLSIENAERRIILDDAVKEADLNVTERLALNKKFFPNGGGFELFPDDKRVHTYNIFYNRNNALEEDSFTKEVEALEIPEHVCNIKKKFYPTSLDSFQANLQLALKKLKKVMQ